MTRPRTVVVAVLIAVHATCGLAGCTTGATADVQPVQSSVGGVGAGAAAAARTEPDPPAGGNRVARVGSSTAVVELASVDPAGLADLAERARRRVAAAWPGPEAGRLQVLLPAGWSQARAGGAGGQRFDGFAAVTEPAGAGHPWRVVLNPEVWARLAGPQRLVLLTHEAFHAASRPTERVPLWLSEGLADVIAYSAADAAADSPGGGAFAALLGQAATAGLPDRLPDDADFSGPGAGVAYEGAHLAVRLLSDRHGEAAVVALYRAVAAAGPAALDALLTELGSPLPDLTAAWRTEVARRAAA